jgi:hypothetical protein
VEASFHSVRFVEITALGSLAVARAAGVAAASAPVVAFNEDHSFPNPAGRRHWSRHIDAAMPVSRRK